MARPADQGRAGGDDAVGVAQGVEGVHRDLPRRKAVHKVDVNHGQFSGIMYAVHKPVYGEQGARQQKNGAAGRSQRSSQGFVRFHGGDHRFVQQGFSKRMHWVRLLSSQIYRDREQSEDTALSENSKRAAPCVNQVYKKLRGL
ncbi:Uncharacterised protein [uncultured Clostridium sp.]|nr:Uncharacterised protein [uncultured Clostridium sp.]